MEELLEKLRDEEKMISKLCCEVKELRALNSNARDMAFDAVTKNINKVSKKLDTIDNALWESSVIVTGIKADVMKMIEKETPNLF